MPYPDESLRGYITRLAKANQVVLQKLKIDSFIRGLSGIYAVNPNNLFNHSTHRKQQALFQPVAFVTYEKLQCRFSSMRSQQVNYSLTPRVTNVF
jgi:hypothetical protein